jgi:N-acetylneuraminic acid mutarotase
MHPLKPTRRTFLNAATSAPGLGLAWACAIADEVGEPFVRRELPPLPDREGFAGMFAGIVAGKLVVAGGANFPRGYPWEGGRKAWYDTVFVLESPSSASWTRPNLALPAPKGYGVSFNWNDSLVIAGGETGPSIDEPERKPVCLASVNRFRFKGDRLEIAPEPPLPEPLKDACGSVIGDRLVLFGGTNSPGSTTASNRLYALDMTDPNRTWKRCPDLPGAGRIQAVAAVVGSDLLIYSGIALEADATDMVARRKPYFKEVWRYSPGDPFETGQWNRLADMPREAAAAPSPAFRIASGEVMLLSGATAADHAKSQQGHSGWGHDVLLHDASNDRWRTLADVLPARRAVVTAPSVRWGDLDVVVSGEIAPGRRTAAVTAYATD